MPKKLKKLVYEWKSISKEEKRKMYFSTEQKIDKKRIKQNHSKENANTMLTFFLLPSIMTPHDYLSLFHPVSYNR